MFTLQIWICDPFANEAIQDMQGVTEAVSKYYYSHVEIFDGLFFAPEYQDRFKRLVNAVMAYGESQSATN